MPLDLLESIRGAEREAEQIRLNAQREGREIVKSVEEAIAAGERGAARDMRALRQQTLDARARETEKAIAAEADARLAARTRMCEDARRHVPEAAKLIAERILEHGDR